MSGKRALISTALVLAGIALLVYGVGFHFRSILVKSETDAPASAQPAALVEPETRIIREVTVGGLALLPSGEIARTYDAEPPTTCHT